MVKLNLKITENNYILYDILSLEKSREKRFIRHIKSFLNGKENGGEVIIPFDLYNKDIVLQNIIQSGKTYNIEIELSSDSIKELQSFIEDEKAFEIFTQKAYEIRNNNCDKSQFEEFCKVLENNLNGRILRPIQLLSSYHLAFSQNACNFSVPGAGKTSIVYGAYCYLNNLTEDELKNVDKLLIIGPLSCFGPWKKEYIECFNREPSVRILSGGVSKDDKLSYLHSSNNCEITLISYQAVPGIVDELIYFLKKNKVMVVLDEAHKIKNTDINSGIIAKSVLELAKYAKSRVILTGTPAPNGYEDLYNLYNFIWPNRKIIKYRVNQLKNMSKNINDSRIEGFISSIEPFFIRIKKEDLEIPNPINNPPILVDMDDLQKEIYTYIENKYIKSFKEDDKNIISQLTKAKLIRLMQAATNPALLNKVLDKYYKDMDIDDKLFIDDNGIISKIKQYKFLIPNKFEKTLDIVKDIINKNEKVIIWTIYKDNLKSLSEYLKSNNIECKCLYGETPVETDIMSDIETRESIVDEFHNPNSSFKVIIANPFAVSESISLHKACHNAIYLERNFNAANFIQSKDRIHRLGLDINDKINYYYILSKNTIDETIHERLEFKEKRLKDIIESSNIPLFDNLQDDFSESDIKKVIDDYVRRVK